MFFLYFLCCAAKKQSLNRTSVSEFLKEHAPLTAGTKAQDKSHVTVSGRVVSRREAGAGLVFYDLRQGGEKLQVFASKSNFKDAAVFADAKDIVQIGDIIGSKRSNSAVTFIIYSLVFFFLTLPFACRCHWNPWTDQKRRAQHLCPVPLSPHSNPAPNSLQERVGGSRTACSPEALGPLGERGVREAIPASLQGHLTDEEVPGRPRVP